MKADYPQDWQDMLRASLRHPPLTLRVNKRKTTVSDYLEILKNADIGVTKLDSDALILDRAMGVNLIPYFKEGWVSVQDSGAQQAGILLNVQEGERVLDACAAPGGKTGHILESAACDLLALDISPHRLTRVEENLNRLGLKAELKCADATKINTWFDGQYFDAILADVPCTASGVLKRHPDIKWLRRPKDADKIASEQVVLLDGLWSCLKSGGRMLMATCSLFPEENQNQLEAFLKRHSDARCVTEQAMLLTDEHDGFYYALIYKN